jgi:hypothetical protein
MSFELQLSVGIGQHQKQIQEDPMTESIFICSEAFLTKWEDASNHQKLLRMFASNDQMKKYRSIMDLLLCRIFPEYLKTCFHYYRFGGKQLRDVASEEEIDLLDKAIFISLISAREVVKRRMPFKGKRAFIGACREVIRQAIPYSTEIAQKHASSTLFISNELTKK